MNIIMFLVSSVEQPSIRRKAFQERAMLFIFFCQPDPERRTTEGRRENKRIKIIFKVLACEIPKLSIATKFKCGLLPFVYQ